MNEYLLKTPSQLVWWVYSSLRVVAVAERRCGSGKTLHAKQLLPILVFRLVAAHESNTHMGSMYCQLNLKR